MSLKFSEHTVELETDSLFHFIRSATILVITAPYRLLSEISLKVIFLGKHSVERMLLCSILLSLIILLLNVCFQYFLGSIALLTGKFPILIMIIGIVCLICIYSLFSVKAKDIYDDLELLKSNAVNGDTVQTEKVRTGDSAQPKDNGIVSDKPSGVSNKTESTLRNLVDNEVFSGMAESTVDELEISDSADENLQFKNDLIFESKGIIDYKNQIRNAMSGLTSQPLKNDSLFCEEDLKLMESEIEDTTDPSKYISEELIQLFEEKSLSDDLQFISDLDLSVIPSDFTMLI